MEPVGIAKNSPTLGTTPNPTSGSIGDTLQDSATLTGGFNPTGNIDFKLFDPTDSTCSGTAAHSESVPLSGSSASTVTGFVANAAGTWNWTADYAGDTNSNSASSGCGQEAVVITVITPSAITLTLVDTGLVGVNRTGTIDVTLPSPAPSV